MALESSTRWVRGGANEGVAENVREGAEGLRQALQTPPQAQAGSRWSAARIDCGEYNKSPRYLAKPGATYE